MKVERVSYPIMTPSAARGVLEAIFWEPQMCFLIDHFRRKKKPLVQRLLIMCGSLFELVLGHGLQLAGQAANVLRHFLQFGIRELLDHAAHDGVTAADLGVVLGLV